MLPFERLYERWPGKSLVVNVDVALIEVPDVREWGASIFGLGQLGPLADLSTQNLSLDERAPRTLITTRTSTSRSQVSRPWISKPRRRRP
jgi:hypothetical protein